LSHCVEKNWFTVGRAPPGQPVREVHSLDDNAQTRRGGIDGDEGRLIAIGTGPRS
jgi:hypothetical protein